jgi:hypothetical protein
VPGLNPGGSKIGEGGRYYVCSRSERSVVATDVTGHTPPSTFIPGTFVKFNRGHSVVW